jgi:hypothetical protein
MRWRYEQHLAPVAAVQLRRLRRRMRLWRRMRRQLQLPQIKPYIHFYFPYVLFGMPIRHSFFAGGRRCLAPPRHALLIFRLRLSNIEAWSVFKATAKGNKGYG